jgi:polyisoprenoid-binding protein YceI
VTFDGTEASLIGGRRMGFSATTVIKRSDFGSKALEGPVGDDVELVIEAEFVHK